MIEEIEKIMTKFIRWRKNINEEPISSEEFNLLLVLGIVDEMDMVHPSVMNSIIPLMNRSPVV